MTGKFMSLGIGMLWLSQWIKKYIYLFIYDMMTGSLADGWLYGNFNY